MVDELGSVPASNVLGVNCRTLALCCNLLRVSRPIQLAPADFRMRVCCGRGQTESVGEGKDQGHATTKNRRGWFRGWFHQLAACLMSAL